MSPELLRVIVLVPVFLFSLCCHEFAHAWVAVKRGDLTPQLMGRLTLHPLAHADWVGTIFLPILCIYYGWPFFGWAKPVPIDMRNLKRGRVDMALVAGAGPLANILLALLSTAWLAVLVRLPDMAGQMMESLQIFSVVSIQVNLMLAFFNLLPLPPLDGFMIAQGVLPSRLAVRLYQLTPYTGLVLLVLLMVGGLRIISEPAIFLVHMLLSIALT